MAFGMTGLLAGWTSSIGMTGAFAVAGIVQVYLERRLGRDFLAFQEEIEIHFVGVTSSSSDF